MSTPKNIAKRVPNKVPTTITAQPHKTMRGAVAPGLNPDGSIPLHIEFVLEAGGTVPTILHMVTFNDKEAVKGTDYTFTKISTNRWALKATVAIMYWEFTYTSRNSILEVYVYSEDLLGLDSYQGALDKDSTAIGPFGDMAKCTKIIDKTGGSTGFFSRSSSFEGTFAHNPKLTELSTVSIKSAVNLAGMFAGDTLLEYIHWVDVPTVPQVEEVENLFLDCTHLQESPKLPNLELLEVGSGVNNLYDGIPALFTDCAGISTFPMIKTDKMSMFQATFFGCDGSNNKKTPGVVHFPNYDFTSALNMQEIFSQSGLSGDRTLNLPVVQNIKNMVGYCPNFNAANTIKHNSFQDVVDADTAFYNTSTTGIIDMTMPKLKTALDIFGFTQIQKVKNFVAPLCTEFTRAFNTIPSLKEVDNLVTSSGKTFTNMFDGGSQLTCVKQVDTTHKTATAGMFDNCFVLVRPTADEQRAILAGTKYKTDSCDAPHSPVKLGDKDVITCYVGLKPVDKGFIKNLPTC